MTNSQGITTGRIVAIWRYPVKSMLGEELNAVEVTDRGLLGDRGLALIDGETGKVVSAKNPRRWPNLFDFRAAFVEPPRAAGPLPAVRITLPDGEALNQRPDRSRIPTLRRGRPAGVGGALRRRGGDC